MIYSNIKLNAGSTLFDFKINNLCLVHKYRPNTVDELSNFEPSLVSIFLVPLKCMFIYTLQNLDFFYLFYFFTWLFFLISFHFFSLFFNLNI